METKINLLKTTLLAVLLLITSTAFAETYYMCSGGTFTMAPATAAPTGMVYRYDVNKDGTTVSTDLTTPPTTFSGEGNYEVITKTVIFPANPALCAPASTTTNFIVLPPLTLTISSPSNPSYCGTATTPSSVITPSTLPVATPNTTDLGYEYSYTVNGVAAVNGDGIGTMSATGVYTLTTTTPGTYVIVGSVKYKYLPTVTALLPNRLLGTTGCLVSSTSRTVTVTAVPSAPTISITP